MVVTWWHYKMIMFSASLAFVTGGFPSQKANNADLWCFLWSAPEQTVEQTFETPVIWDDITLIITSLYGINDCFLAWIHIMTVSGVCYWSTWTPDWPKMWLRKSYDYVYVIWQYKIFAAKELLEETTKTRMITYSGIRKNQCIFSPPHQHDRPILTNETSFDYP